MLTRLWYSTIISITIPPPRHLSIYLSSYILPTWCHYELLYSLGYILLDGPYYWTVSKGALVEYIGDIYKEILYRKSEIEGGMREKEIRREKTVRKRESERVNIERDRNREIY